MIGTMISGYLSTILSPKYILMGIYGLRAVLIVVVVFIPMSVTMVVVFSIFFGVSDTFIDFVSSYFGLNHIIPPSFYGCRQYHPQLNSWVTFLDINI